LQKLPVGRKGGGDRFVGVVKEIEVAREPAGAEQLIQSRGAGEVALAGLDTASG